MRYIYIDKDGKNYEYQSFDDVYKDCIREIEQQHRVISLRFGFFHKNGLYLQRKMPKEYFDLIDKHNQALDRILN